MSYNFDIHTSQHSYIVNVLYTSYSGISKAMAENLML